MSGLKIKKITSFILIREVGNKIVQTNKYIIIIIYVIDIISEIIRTASLIMKIYLVNNLKINILIDTNIIISQEIIVNLKERNYKFGKYQGLIVPINVVTRTQPHFKRIIRVISFITIALDTTTKVFVVYKRVISKNRDFLFEPDYL